MYRDGYIIPCLKKFFYWHFKILDNSEVATYNEDIKRSENAIKKEDAYMAENNKIYITANELAEMLGVSVGHAYKLIRKLNQELEKEGFLVIAGKVPRRYFEKRWYGFSVQEVVE